MAPGPQTERGESSHGQRARTRVAIIGGGCAGMTAAFELSAAEHQGRFDITVYQLGFRLGGKGASGRGVGGRIEEHGLHVWMGFYENAFRLMRGCYDELARDPFRCPVARWQDAFVPAPYVAVTDRVAEGGWEPWLACFPRTAGAPGDPFDDHNPFSVRGYLRKAAALVIELLRSAEAQADPCTSERGVATKPPPDHGAGRLITGIERLLRHGQLATVAALREAMELLHGALELLPEALRGARELLLQLSEAVAEATRRKLATLVAGDVALRRTWHVIDLVLAILRGSIVHGLLLSPQGFDVLDDYDWREWLAMHGANPESLDSGFMRGIYDLAFAYEAGDPSRPALSAAAAMRGAMRMFFTYRGALFWRLSAGMGDIVFAPLYELLTRRGVRFEFFHRLEDVRVSEVGAEAAHVTELHFDVQAELRSGGAYQPLVEVHGLPCWPARPDYAQLVDGERLSAEQVAFESPWEQRVARRRVFKVGQDFDFVVLALGGGAIPGVSRQLIARAPAWQEMERGLHTVATQALQLWLTEDMAQLGFAHPPGNLSGWVEPFDTWADMSHLISAEDSALPIKAIAYFCSPLADPPARCAGEAFQREEHSRVRGHALNFLKRELATLWPNACTSAGDFRWEVLAVEPTGRPEAEGEARLDAQFWTANVHPSDRYTLTLPGTQKLRLSPLDMSFDNLTVAGDWTESGLNTGCVESAVISGRLAAHALSGRPALDEIIGYDHP